jgi:membrane protein involved in colicin uptake
MDDDGGGSLDGAELKYGLKMLIDGAKAAEEEKAQLEKTVLAMRKSVTAQLAEVAGVERARAERIRVEEEEAAVREVERKAAEEERAEEERAKADRARAEKAALKAAEKAKLAAARNTARAATPAAAGSKASRTARASRITARSPIFTPTSSIKGGRGAGSPTSLTNADTNEGGDAEGATARAITPSQLSWAQGVRSRYLQRKPQWRPPPPNAPLWYEIAERERSASGWQLIPPHS